VVVLRSNGCYKCVHVVLQSPRGNVKPSPANGNGKNSPRHPPGALALGGNAVKRKNSAPAAISPSPVVEDPKQALENRRLKREQESAALREFVLAKRKGDKVVDLDVLHRFMVYCVHHIIAQRRSRINGCS
jgi:hypothetical protein